MSAGTAMPHLAAEFFAWLWFVSEREGGTLDLGGEAGVVDVWVDERIAFRTPHDDRVRAVVTGEDTATAAEALAALASGKVVRDVQLHLRKEEREYRFVLRGDHLDLAGAKLPPHAADDDEGTVYERLFLYEELWFLVGELYRRFARERTGPEWRDRVLPALRAWARGEEAPGDPAPAADALDPGRDGG